jgi:hypothetical protein
MNLRDWEVIWAEAFRDEPDWRRSAETERDYVDDKQITAQQRADMEEEGYDPVILNMIRPTLAPVVGMERNYKQDFKLFVNDVRDNDPALAVAAEMKNAERMSRADMAISDAYREQVYHGLGWVEVAGNIDVMGYPITVKEIPRNDIYWDWRSQEYDMSDARYLIRQRWVDVDVVQKMFPRHAKLICKAVGQEATWDESWYDPEGTADTGLVNAWVTAGQTDIVTEKHWRDSARKRVKLYECWYRKPDSTYVIRTPGGGVYEFDDQNQRHVAAVESGLAKLEWGFVNRVRLAWFVGPHLMTDRGSPYKHGRFPYVPFWGFREGNTGIPFGLIRGMMTAQDSINSRLSRMEKALSEVTVIGDDDAFAMSHEEVAEEASRSNRYLRLNPDRRNKNDKPVISFERDLAMAHSQVLQMMTTFLQDQAGVHQQYLGKSEDALSGKAISNLVEQSALGMAEINDNYSYSRQLVGELILYHVKEMIGWQQHETVFERDGRKSKFVFNKRQDGAARPDNSLMRMRLRLEVGTKPQTPAFKQQQRMELIEVLQQVPDETKAMLIPKVIRMMDMDGVNEIANVIEDQIAGMMQGQQEQPEQPQQSDDDIRKQMFAQVEASRKAAEMDAKVDKLRAETEAIRADVGAVAEQQRRQPAMSF